MDAGDTDSALSDGGIPSRSANGRIKDFGVTFPPRRPDSSEHTGHKLLEC